MQLKIIISLISIISFISIGCTKQNPHISSIEFYFDSQLYNWASQNINGSDTLKIIAKFQHEDTFRTITHFSLNDLAIDTTPTFCSPINRFGDYTHQQFSTNPESYFYYILNKQKDTFLRGTALIYDNSCNELKLYH